MHKDHAVRATVRKHSQQGDDDTEYAIAEGGQLFIGCGSSGTSFDVVGCEVLKGEAEKGDTQQLELPHTTKRFPLFLSLASQNGSKLGIFASGTSPSRF